MNDKLKKIRDEIQKLSQEIERNGGFVWSPILMEWIDQLRAVADRIDALLAESEPVAWLAFDGKGWNPVRENINGKCLPLYTTPKPTHDAAVPDDETLKRMAMAYDAEDAAQRGEPSPWTEGDLDPEWVEERIACMRTAMIAAAKGDTDD